MIKQAKSLRKVEGKQIIAISFNRNVDQRLVKKTLEQIKKDFFGKEILLINGTMTREVRIKKEISTEVLDVIENIFPPEMQESFYSEKFGARRRGMARFIHLNSGLVYFIGSIPRESGTKKELETYRTYLGKEFKNQVRFVKK